MLERITNDCGNCFQICASVSVIKIRFAEAERVEDETEAHTFAADTRVESLIIINSRKKNKSLKGILKRLIAPRRQQFGGLISSLIEQKDITEC
jgi:hypothetical protein